MQTLLVISDEPALIETLASELPEFRLAGVRPDNVNEHLHSENFCLVIIDSATNYSIDSEEKNIIRLVRPIRLSDAIYTICQKVKSKTSTHREEKEFSPGYWFSAAGRRVRDGKTGATAALTDKETVLLQHLIENESHNSSRDALLKNVWGYGDDINTHTLETHIYRLRNKLKQLDDRLDIVFTEAGGYRLMS